VNSEIVKMPDMNSQRLQIFPTLARTSPVSFTLGLILYAMMLPSFNSIYLVCLILITNGFNAFLKYAVMKPLYKWSGNNDLFLFGSGSRPSGATSCQFIIDGKKATSFGMPSGHSQIAWTIGTYFICHLINRFINNMSNENKQETSAKLVIDNIWIFISMLTILGVSIYISYSRVYIEGCHTIQQVIVGGTVGILLGFLAFYFEDDIKTKMFK